MANRKKYKSNPKMEVVPVDEVLSDFAFDQVTTLTNRLLKSQVLRTDEIMHVVHSFIHATRTACEAQLCTARCMDRYVGRLRNQSDQRILR